MYDVPMYVRCKNYLYVFINYVKIVFISFPLQLNTLQNYATRNKAIIRLFIINKSLIWFILISDLIIYWSNTVANDYIVKEFNRLVPYKAHALRKV